MEHVRNYDWNTRQRDMYFVDEEDMDNCVIEKILRNKFTDPTISSDEEEETKKRKINWDEVFSKKRIVNFNKKQINVPGMKVHPIYPKLSSLTLQQHYQCLKVLCAKKPEILELEFIPRPTKMDQRVFEEIQEVYLKEQQEYKEWCKTQWVTGHCLRALKIQPSVDMVYDAHYKVQVHAMQAFPKTFEMAAQIPLETNDKCDMIFAKDILQVDIGQLPKIELPTMETKKFIVMSETSVPEPCIKHPCRFVLPNESSMTILPLPEVHRELAKFAVNNGVLCVISEEALQCIIEQTTQWQLALSVCEDVQDDGDTVNVLVISNEFSIERPPAQTRTYRAYTQLVYGALIPPSERRKLYLIQEQETSQKEPEQIFEPPDVDANVSSDDEDEHSLFIDAGPDDLLSQTLETNDNNKSNQLEQEDPQLDKENHSTSIENNVVTEPQTCELTDKTNESILNENQIQIYSCSCKGTIFENPPPRSYKKWRVSNHKNKETYDLIIHCAHKTRLGSSEVILEPIVEYQLELGGSEQTKDKLTSLATSLLLRDNAKLINFRIDGNSGEMVTAECTSPEDLQNKHHVDLQLPANYLYTIINQLQGLLPGEYLLHHNASLGSNAFLYASRCTGDSNTLEIPSMDASNQRTESEEAGMLKAPIISNALLPYHKFRKILPCAFTPFSNQVAREQKKYITRKKAPPQARLVNINLISYRRETELHWRICWQ